MIKIWLTSGSRHESLAIRIFWKHSQSKPSSKSSVQNISETILFFQGCSSSQSQFFRLKQNNHCNRLHQIPLIFGEPFAPPGHFIFRTWSTFLSPRAVTKNSRHHSHNQEHNSGCYDRSQCVDRTAIESCMTRTINSNPMYTRYQEETSKGIIFLGEIAREEKNRVIFVKSTVILWK